MIVLFVLSGCRAKYELDINDDLTVNHYISGLETNEFYAQFNSSVEDVNKLLMATFNDFIYSNDYFIKVLDENNMKGVLVSKNFNSLEELKNSFELYKMYFGDFDLDESDGVYSISLKNKKNGFDFSNRYYVDEGEFIISLPFKVLSHNADRVEGNKYIWNFDLSENTKDDIYIKFDSNKKSGDSNYSFIILLGISVLIISFITFMIIRFFYLRKSKDKF